MPSKVSPVLSTTKTPKNFNYSTKYVSFNVPHATEERCRINGTLMHTLLVRTTDSLNWNVYVYILVTYTDSNYRTTRSKCGGVTVVVTESIQRPSIHHFIRRYYCWLYLNVACFTSFEFESRIGLLFVCALALSRSPCMLLLCFILSFISSIHFFGFVCTRFQCVPEYNRAESVRVALSIVTACENARATWMNGKTTQYMLGIFDGQQQYEACNTQKIAS